MKHQLTKVFLLLLLPTAIFAATETNAYQPTNEVSQYEGYTLIWQDEFDKDGQPDERWSYEYGFVRNRELQWYQP